MTASRKLAWLLAALAAWNVVIWVTFAKNLSAAHAAGEDRPAGYWVAHTVLIVVNLAVAAGLAWIAWHNLRARDRGPAGR